MLKERIELVWTDGEIAYEEEVRKNHDIVRLDYCREKLVESLKTFDDLEDVTGVSNENGWIKICFQYQNQDYTFYISEEGEASLLKLLKGNVGVGEYVEYPLAYCDIYTQVNYTEQNGWRVIDDGVMNGTTGDVKIISSHIPVKWLYDSLKYENVQLAVEDLNNNFEDLDFVNIAHLQLGEEVESDTIKGSYFKIDTLAKKITTLSLRDLNCAYNVMYRTNRKENDISALREDDDLFHIRSPGSYYWLITNAPEDENNLYYMSTKGIRDDYEFGFRLGIRPVVYLKDNLMGIKVGNIWKIVE